MDGRKGDPGSDRPCYKVSLLLLLCVHRDRSCACDGELRVMADESRWSNSFSLGKIQSNFGGNGTKSMRLSVNASLEKLRTDYIDLVCPPFTNHLW